VKQPKVKRFDSLILIKFCEIAINAMMRKELLISAGRTRQPPGSEAICLASFVRTTLKTYVCVAMEAFILAVKQ